MAIDAYSNQTQSLEGVTTSNSSSTAADRVGQQALGQDDFFKLLTTQLASQDPLEPMEDTAFIAQMANFSQLEMTSQLAQSFENFNNTQSFAAAQGYIGKVVSLSSGEIGQVTSVERQDGHTIVFLDGDDYNGRDVATIYKVESVETSPVTSSRQVSSNADSQTDSETETSSSTEQASSNPPTQDSKTEE